MEQVYLVLSAQVWWQILLQIYNYPWSYNSPHLHTILLEPISAPNKSPAVKSGPGSSLTSSPFANCTPEGKVICRNFNRVKGCNLLESSFAHVCNRKINGRACTQPHPSCNHQGSPKGSSPHPSPPLGPQWQSYGLSSPLNINLWLAELRSDEDNEFLIHGLCNGFQLAPPDMQFTKVPCTNYKSATDAPIKAAVKQTIIGKIAEGNYVISRTKPLTMFLPVRFPSFFFKFAISRRQ